MMILSQSLLESQGGVCAICKKEEQIIDKGGGTQRLSVDHDHDTGKIRGLLCNDCNVGLGRFKDNLELLRSAVAYLENGE